MSRIAGRKQAANMRRGGNQHAVFNGELRKSAWNRMHPDLKIKKLSFSTYLKAITCGTTVRRLHNVLHNTHSSFVERC